MNIVGMNKILAIFASVVLLSLVAYVGVFYIGIIKNNSNQQNSQSLRVGKPASKDKKDVVKLFTSLEDIDHYKKKISNGHPMYRSQAQGGTMQVSGNGILLNNNDSTGPATPTENYTNVLVSTTNKNIPSPVKLKGQRIYYAMNYYNSRPVVGDVILGSSMDGGANNIININTSTSIKRTGLLNAGGSILVQDGRLIVFINNNIIGYAVNSNGDRVVAEQFDLDTQEDEVWKITYDKMGVLAGAALHNGKLYIVTILGFPGFFRDTPCPYDLFAVGEEKIVVKCDQIFHPINPVSPDIVYNIVEIDPKTGNKLSNVSLIGSAGTSLVYMTDNAVYTTHYNPIGEVELTNNIIKANPDYFSSETQQAVNDILKEDIPYSEKLNKFSAVLSKYTESDDQYKMTQVSSETYNRVKDYLINHLREHESTDIIKVSLDDMSITGATIPGKPIDDYSLNEYGGNLQVAVRVKANWSPLDRYANRIFNITSTNDIYILDKNMELVGNSMDIGQNTTVETVRFFGNNAFVKMINDPKYNKLFDLSDPKNIRSTQNTTELAYDSPMLSLGGSNIFSYRPFDQHLKLSVFDFTSITDPKESDYIILDYIPDGSWQGPITQPKIIYKDNEKTYIIFSNYNNNYILSYSGGRLNFEKVIEQPWANQALINNDIIYLFNDASFKAWNMKDWSKISEIDLSHF
jgi:uncharacterized secreted protein with C-terminal beta-propeller domain